MRTSFKELFSSFAGGLLVLAPVILLGIAVLRLFGWIQALTAPVVARLGLGGPGSRLIVLLGEIALLLILCLIVGRLLRAAWFGRVLKHSEELVLRLAQALNYVDRVKADALARYDGGERRHWNTVLVEGPDGWYLAFEMERTDAGALTLFVPEAPNADRGSVRHVRSTAVRCFTVPEEEALNVLKARGKGLAALVAAHAKA